MDKKSPKVANIEQAIRRYLLMHPQAIDTERGIREWWLRDVRPRPLSADVHEAIESLVAAGGLARRTLPDGQHGYALPEP